MPPISPDRWRVLSPLLDEALDIDPDRLPSWLQSISARDGQLGAELQAMLAERQVVQRARFLEHPVLDSRRARVQSLKGQVVGAYRLVSPIGEGGSGSVWLAERCDGRFHGQAAVKLLNVSLIGPAGEDRFRREGTILAHLRHPRIAHLIDAGITTTGQPYLVIEHVDGQTIDKYCEERGLPIEARLRLFLDVLEAVAHAHANLIVHRDIKPANVLVSTNGQVKLLDFGIAKLVETDTEWADAGVVDSSELGRIGGAVAMTPEYAAPEQFAGGRVTTATDVYALGVLLYVLLGGRHPLSEAAGDRAALMRAVIGTEPAPLPAVVAATPVNELQRRHAERCGTTPDRLRRLLRGDLDAIVAKAMMKDAADRYPSVTTFADDLRRHLRHEAVTARPATLRYTTLKFARRHATGLGSFMVVVLLVAGLTGLYTRRLAAERDRAERERARSAKVSDLLMGLFTSVDPYQPGVQPREPTVRALLDAGAARVQNELIGDPTLQAEMLTLMGRTYRRLGVYEQAQGLLEQALATNVELYGSDDVRVAQALEQLGGALAEKGDYPAGARSLERALAIRRARVGEADADVAVTLSELGRVYQDQGLNARAEPLHREALAIRRHVLGDLHRETAVSLSDLASVLRLNGDLPRAETALQQSLDINRRTRGADHPNTAINLHDLALIAIMHGDYAKADAELRQVLAMQKKALGERHPVVAMTLNSLAHVLRDEHREEEAEAAQREALAIARAALGGGHQLVAIYSLNLAALRLARHDPGDAEPLVRTGLTVRENAPGIVPSRRRTMIEDDWSIGAARSLLGASLLALHRYSDAETQLVQARHELEAMPTVPAPAVRDTVRRLAALYAAWGKPHDAAAYRALLQY